MGEWLVCLNAVPCLRSVLVATFVWDVGIRVVAFCMIVPLCQLEFTIPLALPNLFFVCVSLVETTRSYWCIWSSFGAACVLALCIHSFFLEHLGPQLHADLIAQPFDSDFGQIRGFDHQVDHSKKLKIVKLRAEKSASVQDVSHVCCLQLFGLHFPEHCSGFHFSRAPQLVVPPVPGLSG